MKPKRLISLLVAVCMMITMLPLSAVTAFAADTSSSTKQEAQNGYMYAYKVNADGETVTITKVLGPVDSANNGPYDIEIPTELGGCTVTGLGEYSFSGYLSAAQSHEPYQFGRNIHSVTIPQSVTSIGDYAFSRCEKMDSLTINDATTSIGSWAFDECYKLTTLSLGKNITTIGDYAFLDCHTLDNVTIPPSVTSIGKSAFYRCYALTTLSLGENIEKIGSYAFAECGNLTNVTIPEKVKTIEPYTFGWCTSLKYITLPAGLTSFKDRLVSCPAGFTKQSPKNGAIYYNNDKTAAERLRDNPDDQSESYHILANRNFLYLCNVIFDANGGSLNDDAEVPVYKTEKITKTKANDRDPINAPIHDPTRAGYTFTGWYTEKNQSENDQPFNVNETAIMEDITLYAGWAPVYHSLTVTGGTATVEKGGQSLNIVPVVTGNKKTYDVPEGAKVTVTLDKDLIPKGNVFDSWSTLPTGQNYTAENITFTMNSDVNVSAKYRDAAADHTPDTDTAVCHPLTVTGGIVTVKKGDKDVTDTLTVTTDEATGKKTYSVPDGATVTVTLDKTLIPEGMVFDGWSTTGNLSLLTGQDYKTETITFTMSSGVNVSAKYRDAATDHTPNAPVCHPLTVTGGTVTVEKDGQSLNIVPDVTGDKKTYSVPEGAEVTVTLDKNTVSEGKVFDGWSTSLPTGQDYKAETITFRMSSGVNVSAKYRDAATDHTHDTAVCHPLTVTGGIVTVKKGDKDVTDTLTVTTDKATGKKTYYVPQGAEVTVTLDKTLIPEGMVFDIWSTGKFSLPLGQDYKAESITFTMNTMSSDVDIAAQYRDATIEDDGPNVLGTAAIIGTAAVGGAVLGYQAYSLGAEFAGKLMALPYFPSNRSALAMMLWEDAGKPMPESELLYPDVGQEAQDMDLQHAARWAMENELIPDLNDEGTAPEEMKFYPDNAVSKIDVLNAWQKAQELKNN